jgi:hypothetical protein
LQELLIKDQAMLRLKSQVKDQVARQAEMRFYLAKYKGAWVADGEGFRENIPEVRRECS